MGVKGFGGEGYFGDFEEDADNFDLEIVRVSLIFVAFIDIL